MTFPVDLLFYCSFPISSPMVHTNITPRLPSTTQALDGVHSRNWYRVGMSPPSPFSGLTGSVAWNLSHCEVTPILRPVAPCADGPRRPNTAPSHLHSRACDTHSASEKTCTESFPFHISITADGFFATEIGRWKCPPHLATVRNALLSPLVTWPQMRQPSSYSTKTLRKASHTQLTFIC